ncbi:dipeptide/oligopeptide/nickel ABC transporter permease/ATP-binding protein [Microbacterium karelineae]|uniref:dipeptide/oligopeptide/nickel ABC transporter permease/ATP-binding protein n=1 Tax=Microbacterium karelineae TaxID=2654283 RepID=UPI0018D2F949|nr:dipeptide/oligopeptide/nickel ABC transporter permease/ATP-binding protein [Microbacterium karelineae]
MSSTELVVLESMRVRTSPLRRLLTNPMGLVSLAILAVAVVIAVLAPVVAPFDPNYAAVGNAFASPGGEHLLGTDSAGRDVWSRLVHSTQITLLSALLCAAVAIAIGLPSGLIAGFYGSIFDGVANWCAGLIMSLPGIIVLLTARAAFGPSVWITMIVFGVLISPSYFRLTRTAVQSTRNELYVDAARVAGLSDGRIIARHILSVVRAPIIIQTAIICGVAIGIQNGMEFLGIGDPLTATWGAMINDAYRNIYTAPLLILWPAIAIGLTIGSLVLLGNAIRDALDGGSTVEARHTQRRSRRGSAPVATDATHLLEVRGLQTGYPRPDGSTNVVVKGVSLAVDRGEVLGIVGESGSGKTQTAFSILGLLPQNARIVGGEIVYDGTVTVSGDRGTDQNALGALRGTRIGYIPQEPMSNLDPAFTIGSQLIRPMVKGLGISGAEARRRAVALLDRVGIPDPERTMRAFPHEISGGMAQRVLIAGAVSCDPDLIIADEPTTALDVTVQAEVFELLREMQRELGMAVIVVSHNFGLIADLADRVVVMREGKIVEEGPVREVLRDPQHPYSRHLLASTVAGREPLTPLLAPTTGGAR